MPFVPNSNSYTSNPVDNDTVTSVQTEKSECPTFEYAEPKYSLSDLIIPDSLYEELQTIIKAQECWKKVFEEWNLISVMKQRKNLFVNLYGEPGTGKTMAAHAIVKAVNKKMIAVNYADIESKYVGETSKNLTALFSFAKNNDAVIFFDEADALLSKRVTNMSHSTDVSVNQTRSVLLTLLNDFEGMVIFATNFIANYDPAFMRRIQYHVKFELPDVTLRERLWRMYIPDEMPVRMDFHEIAQKHDNISGSDISNAVLKAALRAAKENVDIILQSYFEESVERIIQSKNANNPQDKSDLKIIKSETIPASEVPPEIREKAEQDMKLRKEDHI